MTRTITETLATMIYEKDVGIEMSDGNVLRANVFRPLAPGAYPVVLAQGPYGKDSHIAQTHPYAWKRLKEILPDIDGNGSSGRFLRWEMADPERWVPDGYVVVMVDSRGTGKSPGYLDPRSTRETQDYVEVIDWAGTRDWSNGRVGLLGVSYFAVMMWAVAARRPKHLAGFVAWEGFADHYRDWSHHGGIFGDRPNDWYGGPIMRNQHGNGLSPLRDADTGEITTGAPLDPAWLAWNRADYVGAYYDHPLIDAWTTGRSPDLRRIEAPFLSSGNWGGHAQHLRGNIEGYRLASSPEKWLEMHTGTHFDGFYDAQSVALQKAFFDCYLKGLDNGWRERPRVELAIRRPDSFEMRFEHEWPIGRTEWQNHYLDAATGVVGRTVPARAASLTYDAMGEGATFSSAPFAADTEFTGPLSLRLWLSSATKDADLFVTLRCFAPDGSEVVFTGANDMVTVAQGWLRASHRKTDPALSSPGRPHHTHDEICPLAPGEIHEMEVEIWPTCIVVPAGYRLEVLVQGHDFSLDGADSMQKHTHPVDRDPAVFGNCVTIHTGPEHPSCLVLPFIPEIQHGQAK